MKSLKLKMKDVVDAFRLLNDAKYQKLSDDDKVKVWKITRALKPLAIQLEEEMQDAREKFCPSPEFQQKLVKAIEYEKLLSDGKDNLPMTSEEYKNILSEYKEYKNLMDKALNESMDKETSLDIESISEDAFGKLMASNDWTMKQVSEIEFIIGN